MPTEQNQEDGTITRCFRGVRDGVESDIALLWSRCEERLRILAQHRLDACGNRGIVDADDVSNAVFEIFVRKAAHGDFPWLRNRFNLWPILISIANNVIANVARKDGKKGESGLVLLESEMDDTREYLSRIADPNSSFDLIEFRDAMSYLLDALRPIDCIA